MAANLSKSVVPSIVIFHSTAAIVAAAASSIKMVAMSRQ